jgi:hypothetical protein
MKSTIPRRGVQDIHTMSERISDVENPQRKYLAMAMLGLERVRRTREKQSAVQRVANIDRRLAEITDEQRELFAAAKTELKAVRASKRRRRSVDPDSMSENEFRFTY